MSHPYQRMNSGPKEERRLNQLSKLQQQQQLSTDSKETAKVVQLSPSVKQEQKQHWTWPNKVTVLSYGLFIAQLAASASVSITRANDLVNQGIWIFLDIIIEAIAFYLPTEAYKRKSVVSALIAIPSFIYGLAMCLLWAGLNMSAATTTKLETVKKDKQESQEVILAREVLSNAKHNQQQVESDEARECQDKPGKPGSGNGPVCTDYRTTKKPAAQGKVTEATNALNGLLQGANKEAQNNTDPGEKALANLISLITRSSVNPTAEDIKTLFLLLLAVILATSGMVKLAGSKE